MNADDARVLIAPAISAPGGIWADFGAGGGTFTRALAELLGPSGRVYAVDRDRAAVAALAGPAMPWGARPSAPIVPVLADFTRPQTLPALGGTLLHGVLLANSLHFVGDAAAVLRGIAERLRPDGRVVLVEYDRRAASPWVPHPISPARLADLAADAGLTPPTIVATRPSAYSGTIYVAYSERFNTASTVASAIANRSPPPPRAST